MIRCQAITDFVKPTQEKIDSHIHVSARKGKHQIFFPEDFLGADLLFQYGKLRLYISDFDILVNEYQNQCKLTNIARENGKKAVLCKDCAESIESYFRKGRYCAVLERVMDDDDFCSHGRNREACK